jgi:hypothetical protein
VGPLCRMAIFHKQNSITRTMMFCGRREYDFVVSMWVTPKLFELRIGNFV